jgi:hypothetical protein
VVRDEDGEDQLERSWEVNYYKESRRKGMTDIQ